MSAQRLDRRIVLVMAFACGVSIANIYYAQPLLDDIGESLHVTGGAVGLVVTASQVGFALGIAFIVPLGDLLERRRLITRLMFGCALALAATAAAPSFPILVLTLIVVGLMTTVAQVLVPLAAALAHEEERGRVVGTVMSGLLIGILVARTFSGLLADAGSWRLPFAVAAALMLVLVVAVRALLPRSEPTTDVAYDELLKSIAPLIRTEPVLRRRMMFGACGMGSFTILWTALTFLLAQDYGYSEATIGLFGLFGIAGATSAQFAGRGVDRGWLNRLSGVFAALILVGWVLLAFGAASLTALIAGVVVLDFGLQGLHISNQNAIYAIRPESRSRMNTAYMLANFLTAAVASAAASFAYSSGGWTAVFVLGLIVSSLGVLNWILDQLERRRAAALAGA